ncbi:geranylgeranyl reductase family protein [Methanobacterium alcaliphilum]|uniref:geranylgeranyl reductase family protein n=1 Tax=Methanobacterium alcaliphilum TaxID=392018 RepID=UPI00200B7AE4|nr:NAD(P)/FAD-dependent oxidoreductase [Methanobacterium alcaliphilum]MCK9152115.1 NAD(P)/FAD-dependent oxidoreductase [Methanobacterium alcaliphilum]
MNHYDILVVGAGPVGSTFARQMAEKGYNVGVLERKKQIGLPLQCAGLLAKKVKKVNILPDEFIINKVKGAYLHSPSDHILKVSKEKPEAFVLDRVKYDQYLAEIAISEGAQIMLQQNVCEVDLKSGRVRTNGGKELSADIIVDAGGHNSVLSKQLDPKSKKFEAAQYNLKFEGSIFEPEFVNLHVNEYISPGFIWCIPISENEVRIGLFGRDNYANLSIFLNKFIKSHYNETNFKIIKKHHGSIPIANFNKKIIKERSLLLGDAAAQVKPTTGGGLIIGFAAAKMASEAASNALDNEDLSLLNQYEIEYHQKYDKELKNQLRVQKTFEMLTNNDLDSMFLKLKEKGADELISEYGDMDDQYALIKEFIKRGLIFSILPSVLYRRVSEIWKYF